MTLYLANYLQKVSLIYKNNYPQSIVHLTFKIKIKT